LDIRFWEWYHSLNKIKSANPEKVEKKEKRKKRRRRESEEREREKGIGKQVATYQSNP